MWQTNYASAETNNLRLQHGLRTPREEIVFTARPKIQSQSQLFRYGRSIFCLPHRPNFSDILDLCLHWVSVVRDWVVAITKKSQVIVKSFDLIINFFFHFLVYVDMGLSSNNPITLTVVTSGSSFSRSFSIKVTQLDCYSLSKASDGCLQYYTGVSGQMWSFNYSDASGLQLSNADYSICVRMERNFCGIQYSACTDAGTYV